MSTATILLADDEPHITHVVSRKLSLAGYEVMVAGDGEEAMELALERPPSLVITDLQMPHMSGIELAQRLFAEPSTCRVPVIMLTARGYVLEADELERTNIRLMMSKPFSAKEILERSRELLDTDGASVRDAA